MHIKDMETPGKKLMGQLVLSFEVATSKPNLPMFSVKDHFTMF